MARKYPEVERIKRFVSGEFAAGKNSERGGETNITFALSEKPLSTV